MVTRIHPHRTDVARPPSGVQSLFIGVDIGGTNSEIGFVDGEGRCLRKIVIPTLPYHPFRRFIDEFVAQIRAGLEGLSNYTCVGMGVAAPGANSLDGRIRDPTNFGWPDVDLARVLRDFFPFPIRVANDATAAAIGEKKHGAAKNWRNFIMITLGTGLGGGIFVDDQPLIGHRGFAGELGHTPAEPGDRLCGCGRYGCLETYASATGLRRTMLALTAKYGDRSGRFQDVSYNELSARAIWEAACAGDPPALEAFEITGSVLGRKMAEWVPIFDPEAFVLFGGLTRAGSFLLEPVRKAFRASLANVFSGDIPIVLSQVPESEAAILGACHIPEYLPESLSIKEEA
ncbi:ROK family protein [Sulfidibacter corallicola]|uniref:ROK family protein n=1 Tax=Sulfidibacter corallicola TaxID=2818388 RepID=A0A8A4TW88_SULCO|nr:ROK family protein [Sulfidibacter corallicola]QTD53438.1 ROK family protein [Sulfidibacter corallicola]